MFEQDYIMRGIRDIINAILKIVFKIETMSSVWNILDTQAAGDYFIDFKSLVDKNRINEAENLLFDIACTDDIDVLKAGLAYYYYLNDLTDEQLLKAEFSREEIKEGIVDLLKIYKLEGMADLFLR